MAKKYVDRPVGTRELKALLLLARQEEKDFFVRNPHVSRLYRHRLLAIALCQGSALQYLRIGYGVKDFDVHFFYAQNPAKPRLSRAVKRIYASVGKFDDVAVDFIRTVVPVGRRATRTLAKMAIQRFLLEQPTSNARHLAQKGVVGLFPSKVFGDTIWRHDKPADAGE